MAMKGIFIIILLALMLSKSSFAQTCDYRVEIMADGEEFKKEDFKWRMMATKIDGKSTNITGTAEIKSDGKTIKSYKPWTSASISRQKTSSEYSPNLKPGEYEIKAMIEVECDDSDMENNKDTKKTTIEGEKEETTASKSKSEDIEAENKDTANNEINKQAETKQATPNPMQKAAKPIQDEDITIQSTNKNPKNQAIPLATANAVKNTENIYISSSEKAKSLIMVFLLALSILLNIVLIWKR